MSLITKRWKFSKGKKIEYLWGSSYHPQSQGAIELLNRTIQNFLYLSNNMNLDEFNKKFMYAIYVQ